MPRAEVLDGRRYHSASASIRSCTGVVGGGKGLPRGQDQRDRETDGGRDSQGLPRGVRLAGRSTVPSCNDAAPQTAPEHVVTSVPCADTLFEVTNHSRTNTPREELLR